MRCRMTDFLALPLVTLLLAGCTAPPGQPEITSSDQELPQSDVRPAGDPMVSVGTILDAPEDYARVRIDTDAYPVPSYAQYLEGVRICLDPGHGGQPQKWGYKRGPTGVREAEINLRVAKYLRDLLEYAGAEVLLTRQEDVDLSVKDRAEKANAWGADIFISCHHNAIDNKPEVNRTTVWYEGDIDRYPACLDLARYICLELHDGLGLEQLTGIPLKSDSLMKGFGVLRNAKVTAALTESSFFSNPEEEQRLRDPEYNLQEAYSLFLGLAKYAFTGLPRATLVEPADARLAGNSRIVQFKLDDGLRSRKSWGSDQQMILTDSVAVRVDGQPVDFEFDGGKYELTAHLPETIEDGTHVVDVQFQNMHKNSVLNPRFEIVVGDGE